MFGSRTATSGRSIWSRVAILVACFALVAAVLPATAGAVQPTAKMHSGKTSITKVGTSRIAKVAKPITPGSGASVGEFGPREENLDAKVSGSQSAARVPAAHAGEKPRITEQCSRDRTIRCLRSEKLVRVPTESIFFCRLCRN